MKTLFAVITILIALNVSSPAYSTQTTGEWWEVTQKMEMPGMPDFSSMMPGGGASKVCISSDLETKPFSAGEDAKNCVISDVKTSGKTTTFKMKCTGENALTGSGEIKRNTDSFSQKVKVQSSDGDMLLVSTGKRIGGACNLEQEINKLTNSAEHKKLKADMDKDIAASKKASDKAAAGMNQYCAVDSKRMDPKILEEGRLYFDSGAGSNRVSAQCKTQQNAFCIQTLKVVGTPDGYRKYSEIRRAFIENAEVAAAMYTVDTVKACKIDSASLQQEACKSARKSADKNKPWVMSGGSGSGTEAWEFMADFCPADAAAYQQKTCSGADTDKSDGWELRYAWCRDQSSRKNSSMSQPGSTPQATNAGNPPSKAANASETVEQSKARAVQEGVTEGVKKGMNKLKGFFK